MIRREDLLEAIVECEGVLHPTSSTCLKLASYYTILKQMDGEQQPPVPTVQQYSFQMDRSDRYESDTEFAQVVSEKGLTKCMPILDEAMQALLVVNQRMYEGIMRKLRSL